MNYVHREEYLKSYNSTWIEKSHIFCKLKLKTDVKRKIWIQIWSFFLFFRVFFQVNLWLSPLSRPPPNNSDSKNEKNKNEKLCTDCAIQHPPLLLTHYFHFRSQNVVFRFFYFSMDCSHSVLKPYSYYIKRVMKLPIVIIIQIPNIQYCHI